MFKTYTNYEHFNNEERDIIIIWINESIKNLDSHRLSSLKHVMTRAKKAVYFVGTSAMFCVSFLKLFFFHSFRISWNRINCPFSGFLLFNDTLFAYTFFAFFLFLNSMTKIGDQFMTMQRVRMRNSTWTLFWICPLDKLNAIWADKKKIGFSSNILEE